MTLPDPWPAPFPDRPVDAVVRLPGSKSLTNRYLVLAALADGPSRLRRPLRSRDTLLMAEALATLGADVRDAVSDAHPVVQHHSAQGDPSWADWVVQPNPVRGGGQIDCGLAGTVMRFLPPMAALADGPVRFDGDEVARIRPMGAGLSALRALGVHVADSGSATLPFTVTGRGRVEGGRVSMDASASSQFVSALLLAGTRYEQGIEIVHDGAPLPSLPHIAMTVSALRDCGVLVEDSQDNRWRVEPGGIHALDVEVEPDLSNAATFLAAAMVTGGRVHVPGWPGETTQAGDAIRDIFDAMGGEVSLAPEGLTLTGPDVPSGLDVDLHDVGELTPVVAAVAALADSPSRLRGIAHLRGHETDRLAALAQQIGTLGGDVRAEGDGLLITPRALHGATVSSYADHRMAMSAAVLGLAVPGVFVQDIATTGKTLPDFPGMWQSMSGGGTS